MLTEGMTALAAAGGAAVVQAAVTDAWTDLRRHLAAWLGRGHRQAEQAELERLDRTEVELRNAPPGEAERIRLRQETAWATRIETLLEHLDDPAREPAAQELQALLEEHTPRGGVSAGPGGLAVGRDMTVTAETGGAAAGVIQGGVHMSPPPGPAPSQG
ncbi:hypothetical protein ACFVFI_33180 [Streptomyces sp. NPDC057705]|uniref:hypothetical protein n=1 Tax=Streptomyces sp. NPDC057705 TaxID=3346222 RepID=UPI0036A69527